MAVFEALSQYASQDMIEYIRSAPWVFVPRILSAHLHIPDPNVFEMTQIIQIHQISHGVDKEFVVQIDVKMG